MTWISFHPIDEGLTKKVSSTSCQVQVLAVLLLILGWDNCGDALLSLGVEAQLSNKCGSSLGAPVQEHSQEEVIEGGDKSSWLMRRGDSCARRHG
jgi:hypothetical protein